MRKKTYNSYPDTISLFEKGEYKEEFKEELYYLKLSASIQKLNQEISELSDSISDLKFRLDESEKEKSTTMSALIDSGITAFSVFIISGMSGAIILNNTMWGVGLLGPFLGVVVYWSWYFYNKRKEQSVYLKLKEYLELKESLISNEPQEYYLTELEETNKYPITLLLGDLAKSLETEKHKTHDKYDRFRRDF